MPVAERKRHLLWFDGVGEMGKKKKHAHENMTFTELTGLICITFFCGNDWEIMEFRTDNLNSHYANSCNRQRTHHSNVIVQTN